MSDNEGMPDTPYREMSFLDEIIDYHRPHPKPKLGGSVTATWRGLAGPFRSTRFDALFADIGFWTALTNVHDSFTEMWLSSPIFPNLDPLPPGGAGELHDGDVRIDVGLVGAFSGAGTFRMSATATMTNPDFSPRDVGIAIVKFTTTVLLPLTNPGNVRGYVGEVIASSVASLNPGETGDFGCAAAGDAYEVEDPPFPSRTGGLFALGIVGGRGLGSFSLTHLAPPPPPPPASPPPPP